MKKTISSLVLVAPILTACTATSSAPPPAGMNLTPDSQYIDTIEFRFPSDRALERSQKNSARCALTHISSTSATLSGSYTSYTGPLTGITYAGNKSETVTANNVLQGADKESGFIAASGNTDYTQTFGFVPIKYSIRFTALVSPAGDAVVVQFKDIARAQLDTGTVANNGFTPVGYWDGAKPLDVYTQLQRVATKVGGCITGT